MNRRPGRHTGDYLTGPGSLVDGHQYMIGHHTDIAALPAWLAELLAA